MEYTDEDAETQIETENGEDAWVATHSGRGKVWDWDRFGVFECQGASRLLEIMTVDSLHKVYMLSNTAK